MVVLVWVAAAAGGAGGAALLILGRPVVRATRSLLVLAVSLVAVLAPARRRPLLLLLLLVLLGRRLQTPARRRRRRGPTAAAPPPAAARRASAAAGRAAAAAARSPPPVAVLPPPPSSVLVLVPVTPAPPSSTLLLLRQLLADLLRPRPPHVLREHLGPLRAGAVVDGDGVARAGQHAAHRHGPPRPLRVQRLAGVAHRQRVCQRVLRQPHVRERRDPVPDVHGRRRPHRVHGAGTPLAVQPVLHVDGVALPEGAHAAPLCRGHLLLDLDAPSLVLPPLCSVEVGLQALKLLLGGGGKTHVLCTHRLPHRARTVVHLCSVLPVADHIHDRHGPPRAGGIGCLHQATDGQRMLQLPSAHRSRPSLVLSLFFFFAHHYDRGRFSTLPSELPFPVLAHTRPSSLPLFASEEGTRLEELEDSPFCCGVVVIFLLQ
eukprot:Rhum_TRINITY_DN14076_c1_g1::Rhum_TRINITY_DN14076_c1_g1_i1::g.68524::m.68524